MNHTLFFSIFLFIIGLFAPLNMLGLSKTFCDPRLYVAMSLCLLLIRYKKSFNKKINEIEKLIPFAIGSIFLHSLVYKYLSWLSVDISGYDYSHYDYAIWNISQGNGAFLSVAKNEGFFFVNVLGTHFRPVLYLLSIPQILLNSHFYVFFLQSSSVLFSMVILNKICEEIFPNNSLTKMFFVIGAGFNLYYLSVFKFVFQPEIFYIPLSFLLVYFVFKVNTIGLVLTSIVFLTIKEDAPLLLLSVWGMYIVFGKSFKTTLTGIISITSCVTYYLVVTKYVMPDYQLWPSSSFVSLWAKYGTSMIGIVKGALLNPHLVFVDILTNKSLYLLLLSLAFMPILTPLIFVSTISVVILTTASYPQLNQFGVYYASYVVGFFYICAVFGVAKLKRFRTPIVALVVMSGMLMGLGKYALPNPNLSLFNEIKQMQDYFDTGCQNIYVSGNMLHVLDYSESIRRFSSIDDAIQNACQIVLLKETNSVPISSDDHAKLLEAVRSRFTKIDYESDAIIFASR